ncbi:DNA (cytosine-5-)-methyltransferase [Flavobacteriaceae bacterium]|nr:DNA (cytosine-5-)-methyltransferase [Flavobacteriaceae bacterium]
MINLFSKLIKNKGKRFIDLYAGLGGFHQGLRSLGHKCVWASEINQHLVDLYKLNYPGVPIKKDIFKIDPKEIPEHEILTAGFPCQPFSRSGYMQGFNDLKRGNHFFKILEILKYHKTECFILENVDTLKKHDKGNTFSIILNELRNIGYEVDFDVLSPNEFNIPQIRKRIFIVGRLISKGGLGDFSFPEKEKNEKCSIDSLTFKSLPNEALSLNDTERQALNFWEEFLINFPEPENLPSFPIWSMEFGANYEFEKSTPFYTTVEDLIGKRGLFGKKIPVLNKEDILKESIPRYSSLEQELFPAWKKNFIRQNREFYREYKSYIDPRMDKLKEIKAHSYQKLEWACKGESTDLNDKIIQFRPSGVRISRNRWVPTLTTIKTQNIYLKKIDRRLSILEHEQLQSQSFKVHPNHLNGGYRALGNSVNSEVVKRIAKNLIL